ncbi:MAG TPA: TfoX/Sxy family protein [Micromonosporaceae bacterium]|nr:TfoX/Sxy family protein [Micromonosporaceae bacterium]
MAYDEELAGRVRTLLGRRQGITEKRMFGGLAMLLNGNMAVVIRGKGGLLVRVDPDEYDQVQVETGAAPAVMRGRPMRGWITVESIGCTKQPDLKKWVDRGVSAARRLPEK